RAAVRRRRPAHDEWITDATLVRLPLPAAKRRVPRQRPSPWVVPVCVYAPQPIEHRTRRLDVVRQAVEDEVLVECPVPTALRAGAVAAEGEHDGAVELAAPGEKIEQAAHVMVRVREEAGIDLHHARVDSPLLGRQRRPLLYP